MVLLVNLCLATSVAPAPPDVALDALWLQREFVRRVLDTEEHDHAFDEQNLTASESASDITSLSYQGKWFGYATTFGNRRDSATSPNFTLNHSPYDQAVMGRLGDALAADRDALGRHMRSALTTFLARRFDRHPEEEWVFSARESDSSGPNPVHSFTLAKFVAGYPVVDSIGVSVTARGAITRLIVQKRTEPSQPVIPFKIDHVQAMNAAFGETGNSGLAVTPSRGITPILSSLPSLPPHIIEARDQGALYPIWQVVKPQDTTLIVWVDGITGQKLGEFNLPQRRSPEAVMSGAIYSAEGHSLTLIQAVPPVETKLESEVFFTSGDVEIKARVDAARKWCEIEWPNGRRTYRIAWLPRP